MQQNTLKVGIIGVGYLGTFHARIFSAMPTVAAVGIYDPDEQRCAELAQKYNVSVFSSQEELIASSDVLSIVAPTRFHHEIAIKCLEKNKDIFIEKPIASTVDEAEAIEACANKKGCIVQVGHVERFNAVVEAVKPLIKSPRFIQVDRLGPHSFRSTDICVVRDLMIHDIDILLHLVNSPIQKVDAIGVSVISDIEDLVNARIIFENGCVANVNASRASIKQVRKIRIFQENVCVSIDYKKQRVHIYSKKERAKGSFFSRSFSDYIQRRSLKIQKNQPLDEELLAFVRCVYTREEPLVSAHDGTEALRVAQEIQWQIKQSLS